MLMITCAADLQNLKLIEMPPRSAGFPRENI